MACCKSQYLCAGREASLLLVIGGHQEEHQGAESVVGSVQGGLKGVEPGAGAREPRPNHWEIRAQQGKVILSQRGRGAGQTPRYLYKDPLGDQSSSTCPGTASSPPSSRREEE